MVRQNNQVNKSVRTGGKYIKEVLARFIIPSFEYLNMKKAGYNSAESQILAMKLKINSRLGNKLFENTVISVIEGTKGM